MSDVERGMGENTEISIYLIFLPHRSQNNYLTTIHVLFIRFISFSFDSFSPFSFAFVKYYLTEKISSICFIFIFAKKIPA